MAWPGGKKKGEGSQNACHVSCYHGKEKGKFQEGGKGSDCSLSPWRGPKGRGGKKSDRKVLFHLPKGKKQLKKKRKRA